MVSTMSCGEYRASARSIVVSRDSDNAIVISWRAGITADVRPLRFVPWTRFRAQPVDVVCSWYAEETVDFRPSGVVVIALYL